MLVIDGKLTTNTYQKNGVNIYSMQVLAQNIKYLSSPGSLKNNDYVDNNSYISDTQNQYINHDSDNLNNAADLFKDDDLPFR